MQTYKNVRQDYNRRTDVLIVGWGDALADVADDTPSGLIVYYTLPSREPVGLEVLDYCARFGGSRRMIEVDAVPSFGVDIAAVECDGCLDCGENHGPGTALPVLPGRS